MTTQKQRRLRELKVRLRYYRKCAEFDMSAAEDLQSIIDGYKEEGNEQEAAIYIKLHNRRTKSCREYHTKVAAVQALIDALVDTKNTTRRAE